MFRFFVDKKVLNHFLLDENTLQHIKVARIESDFFICIFEKKFYKCRLENNRALIIEEVNESHEHSGEVIIALAVIKIKRFEWAIQKAAELGATKLIPFVSKNVSTKVLKLESKHTRWNQIALSASQQAFRNQKMVVAKVHNFDDVLTINSPNKFIANAKDEIEVYKSFPTPLLFLVGPEGGFSDEEVKKAQNHGFVSISFGPRILRSETAALFALSRVN